MDQYGGSSFTRATLSSDGFVLHAPTDCAAPYLYYCAVRLLSYYVVPVLSYCVERGLSARL